jgi:hypothetical protein
MRVTRRKFLATAVTAAGTAATPQPAAASDHDHQTLPSDLTLRVKSLESLLVEKGLVDRAALDALVDIYEHKIEPRNGARVVAKAWTDPEYKRRLLTDADGAIAEFGYVGQQGEHMVVVENTSEVHNMVVCTLCSCYPWPTLGLPPVWYKSAPYRSRADRPEWISHASGNRRRKPAKGSAKLTPPLTRDGVPAYWTLGNPKSRKNVVESKFHVGQTVRTATSIR